MRMITKVLGAVAVAGLAAAGGTISTASNTMPSSSVIGYGQATVTGATVDSIAYTPKSTDTSKLDTVTFQVTTDITGKAANLTLKNAGSIVGASYSCTNVDTETPWTVVCDTSGVGPLFSAFDATGLTVS